MSPLPKRIVPALLLALLAIAVMPAHAARIKELCEVDGARENMLKGIGIIVGLNGTGDKAQAAVVAQERVLRRLDIEVENLKELSSSNAAIVAVTATIPAYAKEGTRIDVKVSSIYDAKSLEGGTLLETHLTGPGSDETVYAVAQGAISIGGFSAGGGGGTGVKQNHVTAGRIPMGAYVEHEVPSTITDGQRIKLLLKQPDFTTASSIQHAIDVAFGASSASALGAGTILVTIPKGQQNDLVGFISQLEEVKVRTQAPSRVVINENTGTIVVGGNVIIKPCQVAHGDLTIEIASTPQVSQPGPLSRGSTVVTAQENVAVTEEEGVLREIKGTSAAEVAKALNKLRISPRDMISIFQAIREAGALEADLEIM